jgi:hypothetical protein
MPKWYEVVMPHQIVNQYHENINYERLMSFTPLTNISEKAMVTLKIL